MEYVRDGQITLNISLEATKNLQLGNEWIDFTARFGGIARDIQLPVRNVLSIYARENGQGMVFEVTTETPSETNPPQAVLRLATTHVGEEEPPPDGNPPRPMLKRVK
jgi:stringent starvation protein B